MISAYRSFLPLNILSSRRCVSPKSVCKLASCHLIHYSSSSKNLSSAHSPSSSHDAVLKVHRKLFVHKLEFFDTKTRKLSNKNEPSEDHEIDDLKKIFKDKSIGVTEKFKILFKQYGTVLVFVYVSTTLLWLVTIYSLLVKGVDVIPMFEKFGIFTFLEAIGFTYAAEALKNPDASCFMVTYLIYEILKPVRTVVTLFGTVYAVRYLRAAGYLKPLPKSATVKDLVKAQSEIIHRQVIRTSEEYRKHYKTHVRRKYRSEVAKKQLLKKKDENKL